MGDIHSYSPCRSDYHRLVAAGRLGTCAKPPPENQLCGHAGSVSSSRQRQALICQSLWTRLGPCSPTTSAIRASFPGRQQGPAALFGPVDPKIRTATYRWPEHCSSRVVRTLSGDAGGNHSSPRRVERSAAYRFIDRNRRQEPWHEPLKDCIACCSSASA